MAFKRKQRTDDVVVLPKEASRLDRVAGEDVVTYIEAELARCAEVMRGFHYTKAAPKDGGVDPDWLLSELEAHLVACLSGVRSLARRPRL